MIVKKGTKVVLIQGDRETEMTWATWQQEYDKAITMKNEILDEHGGYSRKLNKNPRYALWLAYFKQLST